MIQSCGSTIAPEQSHENRTRIATARKKKGTCWTHHEGILSKRAFGFSGGCETDDYDLVLTDDYRHLRCVTSGTIPNVHFTLIHNGSFVPLHLVD